MPEAAAVYRLQRVTPKGAPRTFGVLVGADGTPVCVTLERPDLDDAPDVSCIPAGSYRCARSPSPHLGYVTWEVLDVPGRTGIRLHIANLVHQLEGCVALGEAFGTLDGEPAVLDSHAAFDAWMQCTAALDTLLLEVADP